MDDRKQRVIVKRRRRRRAVVLRLGSRRRRGARCAGGASGKSGVKIARGSRALADERRVKDLIVFADPVGNRLEAFHGAETASEPFKPGRSISGFRTGPLGMGHAVLTAERLEEVVPFYTDILDFRLSDYILRPFKAYFFHLNPRHHSLAFIDTGKNGIHHLMVELCYLDDVGQAYDLALRQPETIGATLGRHANDEVTSFYSCVAVEIPGRIRLGRPHHRPRQLDAARAQRRSEPVGPRPHVADAGRPRRSARSAHRVADAGGRAPLNVMDGNYLRARDVCPWWNANTAARKTG